MGLRKWMSGGDSYSILYWYLPFDLQPKERKSLRAMFRDLRSWESERALRTEIGLLPNKPDWAGTNVEPELPLSLVRWWQETQNACFCPNCDFVDTMKRCRPGCIYRLSHLELEWRTEYITWVRERMGEMAWRGKERVKNGCLFHSKGLSRNKVTFRLQVSPICSNSAHLFWLFVIIKQCSI